MHIYKVSYFREGEDPPPLKRYAFALYAREKHSKSGVLELVLVLETAKQDDAMTFKNGLDGVAISGAQHRPARVENQRVVWVVEDEKTWPPTHTQAKHENFHLSTLFGNGFIGTTEVLARAIAALDAFKQHLHNGDTSQIVYIRECMANCYRPLWSKLRYNEKQRAV